MFCIVCGRRNGEAPIAKLPVAMSPDLGLCLYHEQYRLRGASRESDRLLSEQAHTWVPKPRPKCLHCGQLVLFVGQHSQPLWCQECEGERRRIAERGGGS